MSTGDTPEGHGLEALQNQLTDFIHSENNRLNRLIVNLYLKFTLEAPSETDVFFSACHSIAEYFHADGCEILRSCQNEADAGEATSILSAPEVPQVLRSLELSGAFGAWERALHSPFVRRRAPIAYPSPKSLNIFKLGNSQYFWVTRDPVAFTHRGLFLPGHDDPEGANTHDVPHQQAWWNNSLAGSCRTILASSLRRPEEVDNVEEWSLSDGVLKVENRRPRGIRAFRHGAEAELLLKPLWQLTGLRPYLRYLRRFKPGIANAANEKGWRRIYAQLTPACPWFEELRSLWFDTQAAGDVHKSDQLLQKLRPLESDLKSLLNLTILAETYLQHLRHVLVHLAASPADCEADSPLRNVPSLFNLVNIARAYHDSNAHPPAQLTRLFEAALQSQCEKWECENSRQAVSGVLSTLVNDFLAVLHWPPETPSLQALLDGLASRGNRRHGSLHYDQAYGWLTGRLTALATALEGWYPQAMAQAGAQESLKMECRRLHASVLTTLQLASESDEQVRQRHICGAKRSQADAAKEPNAAKDFKEDQYFASDRFANALAAAAMHTHTFGEADEARILFVSRRVAQLMDNHIVRRAQHRGIRLSHENTLALHLDEFSLEQLVRIQQSTRSIATLLKRSVVWWVGRQGADPGFHTPWGHVPQIEQFIALATSLARSTADANLDVTLAQVTIGVRDDQQEQLCQTLGLPVPQEPSEAAVWIRAVAPKLSDEVGGHYRELTLELVVRLSQQRTAYATANWLLSIARNLEDLERRFNAWCDSAQNSSGCQSPPTLFSHSAAWPGTEHEGSEPKSQAASAATRLSKLRQCLDNAIAKVQSTPARSDDLFSEMEKQLSDLCEAIANMVRCDSCAIFMLDDPKERETVPPGAKRRMIMRGASGRLAETLEAVKKKQPGAKGVEYETCWVDKDPAKWQFLEGLDAQALDEVVLKENWSLTNAIWHLGAGRIASSRAEFERMARRGKLQGQGDQFAYPPDGRPADAPDELWTLFHIFRSFIGIPIFARGGRTDFVPQRDAVGDATRNEFHSQYRVVGILKLEGKQPPERPDARDESWWWDAIPQACQRRIVECVKESGVEADNDADYLETAQDWVKLLFNPPDPGNSMHARVCAFAARLLKRPDGLVDTDMVDAITNAFGARWTPEDVELLVAIAMEIGRLRTLRTLHLATQQQVFLGENDIGLLDIRLSDIRHIKLVDEAAEVACRKVEFELERLRDELTMERHFATQADGAAPMHDAIVRIEARKKRHESLFAKLVRRQVQQSTPRATAPASNGQLVVPPSGGEVASVPVIASPPEGGTTNNLTGQPGPENGATATTATAAPVAYSQAEVCLGDPQRVLRLPHSTGLESEERILNGYLKLHVRRGKNGDTAVRKAAGDVRCGQERARWRLRDRPAAEPDAPFIQRVFSPDGFGLDDWSGVRVVCCFLSDVQLVLDTVRARFARHGMLVDDDKVEVWLDAPHPDGYRGVHLTVMVPLDALLPPEKLDTLAGVLPLYQGRPLMFPCEIQLRSQYQDSWSRASHSIQYKRDMRMDLGQYMEYLSGLLFQSDKIMDLVREAVEAEQPKLVELLAHLRSRLPDPQVALVSAAAALARKHHESHYLYGGRPHFEHLVCTAHRLLNSFGIDDPWMLVLAFFQDLWMHEDPEGNPLGQDAPSPEPCPSMPRDQSDTSSTRQQVHLTPNMHSLARRACSDRLAKLRGRLGAGIQHVIQKGLALERSGRIRRMCDALPENWPLQTADKGDTLVAPDWFWYLLENFRRSWLPLKKDEFPGLRRLQLLDECLQGQAGEEAALLERRSCVLEIAIQLTRLSELPHDPLRDGAIEELEFIYQLLERIRRRIGGEVRGVLRLAERDLRRTADILGTHLPIDWET